MVDEELSGEIGQDQQPGNVPGHRPEASVDREIGGKNRRAQSGTPVTGVPHAGGERPIEAAGAGLPLAEEICVQADLSIVVDRHHGRTIGSDGVEDRPRGVEPGVVHVREVGLDIAHQASNPPMARGIPERGGQRHGGLSARGRIEEVRGLQLVALRRQVLSLTVDDGVFTTRLPILCVEVKNPNVVHGLRP